MSELVDYLPRLPRQYGIKQPAVVALQGEDVVLTFPLKQRIDTKLWTNYECHVKKNNYASNTLWLVKPGSGLTVTSSEFQMVMPTAVSSLFLPGTYHIVLVGRQRLGEGNPIDRITVLGESMFELQLSAASPSPKLSGDVTVAVERDPNTGQITIIRTGVEPTVPLNADPTRN